MEALGVVDSIERAADLVAINDVVQPDAAAAATYASVLPVFARLHEALGPAFRQLREPGRRGPG
jgi:gluconokinase